MVRDRWHSVLASMQSARGRDALTIWIIVFLMSGQGFRYLLGIPLYAVVAVVTVATAAWVFRTELRHPRVPLLIGAFVGLSVASVAWSSSRAVTVVAAIVTVATTMVAVATVRSVSNVHFTGLLYRGLQLSLALGLVFEVIVAFVFRRPVSPLSGDIAGLDPDPDDIPLLWSENLLLEGGPIQGFVGNRNPFGALALFAAIVAVVLLLERRISRVDGFATLVAAGAVHVLTESATVSVAALYIAVLAISALTIRRVSGTAKRALSLSILACTAIAAVLTVKYRLLLFELFDRRPDVTNRTDIWREVVLHAERRPEGWGFVGYWPIWNEPYASIVDNSGVRATHAHNAFLDAWLQLGLIGVVLLLAIVILAFGSAWRLVERASHGDTFIPLGWALIAAALALQALTESRLLVEGGWYLLVVLSCMAPQVFKLTIVDPELVHYGTATASPDVSANPPPER